MAAEASGTRKERLSTALKENLKRRKAQARAKAAGSPEAKAFGTAPQAGLADGAESGPKSAPKRN